MGPNGPCEPLDDDPELVIADLDLDDCAGADPAGWDIGGDARPDIYAR
jgi:hypothetical protein